MSSHGVSADLGTLPPTSAMLDLSLKNMPLPTDSDRFELLLLLLLLFLTKKKKSI